MRRLEIMTREADNKILELQNSGKSNEILPWIIKKVRLTASGLNLMKNSDAQV